MVINLILPWLRIIYLKNVNYEQSVNHKHETAGDRFFHYISGHVLTRFRVAKIPYKNAYLESY